MFQRGGRAIPRSYLLMIMRVRQEGQVAQRADFQSDLHTAAALSKAVQVKR